MDESLPSALIIGIDNFVAKKLAEELAKKNIGVIGVGDFVMGLGELENFKWIADLDEIEGKFNYVFDFRGELSIWEKEKIEGEKVTFISVDEINIKNKISNKLKSLKINWRLIEAGNVYGVGMEDINFVSNIFRLAVKNKNLEVPLPEQEIKLLHVDDLVEVILRASFLSNTEGKEFLILGKEIKGEDLARILIDKAKMTKLKVFQKKIDIYEEDINRSEDSQKKLRWKAKIDLKDGIKEVLQYFFSEVDNENRKKKKDKKSDELKKVIEKEKVMAKVEVVVEEDDNEDDDWEFNNLKKKSKNKEKEEELIDEGKKETEIVEEEMIEEESEEFLEAPKEVRKIKNNNIEIKEKNIKKKWSLLGRKKNKANRFWLLLLIAGLLLMILIIPIDWGLNSYLTIRNIKNIPELIESKKYIKAESLVNKNLNKLTEIDSRISDWGLNKIVWFRNYQNSLKVMEELLEIESKMIGVVKPVDLLMGGIFEEKEIDWESNLTLIEEGLVELEGELGVLEARLSGDLSWLPGKWRSEIQKEEDRLEKIKEQIGLGINSMEILPEFLGLDGRKREYLVLFQNESELRAGGGFIGSYGLLTFENGKLLDLDIKDIYEADGQLKGHVEPPIEIKKHLNEANWYMRDANWKADFGESATDIQWFLNKEVNKKVDGVIGVNLAVAKGILEVTGEVYVNDFGEKINKDNLYEQAEFYAEKKFFPGSNQKASFLGGLGKQIFEEIRALDMVKKGKMMGMIIDLLEKNEIQLAFNNQEVDKKMSELGWNGEIYQGKCGSDNCIMDYFYLVESNFGVNKANYFIYRNIEEMVDISNNSISRVVKIVYENTAKNNNWPGGDYKNYIRVYLPLEVNLSQVAVMDGIDTTIKKVYKSNELRIREINGKKEVGFLMTVPVNKKRIVELRYSSNLSLQGQDKFSYVSYIQRQSGFGETGLVSLVSFPEDWQIVQVQPMASLVGGKLLFNQKLDKDIKMGVEIEK